MRIAGFVCALVAGAHFFAWTVAERRVSAPVYNGVLQSVSYTPFDGSAHPDSRTRTTRAQIRADLTAIAPLTKAVRTYSSTSGSELIPEIAEELGLKTSVGAWVDRDEKRNERELLSVIQLANMHRSVESIVVGNETIYRADQSVEELIKKINYVKHFTSAPVTTGEIWNVWLEHPELVAATDFIAAHILPYWEGISVQEAVPQAQRIYDKLRAAYPNKRIVIAEFGWPSAGHNRRDAQPGRIEQARVMREFLNVAEKRGMEYNIIEAYDQPWKTFEGGVGPYWGLYDTSRQPKFSWKDTITYPGYAKLSMIAVVAGVALSLPMLFTAGVTVAQALLMSLAANAVGAWGAYLYDFWTGHYFVPGAAFSFWLGVVLLIPLVITSMWKMQEIADLVLGRRPKRLITKPLAFAADAKPPKVSIHIPACKEQPHMVNATLDAVARLEYPNFECIVIVNNTPDPAMWKPIEQHCLELGSRFKFLREDKVEGFKAGALRIALQATAPDAELIGLLDADYVVQPNWLTDLVPMFQDAKVGIVQAPQDHRDGDRSVMHGALNSEYAGFFDIGMVHRNEADAIVVHGTMCLIRRAALQAAGNWSSDTICEDTDLGLSIIEKGWSAHYTDKRYGHGLLPDTYLSFKRQRYRWAFGGLQIAKKHWRNFIGGRSQLTGEQSRVFSLGWLSWLGAESLGALLALLNLVIVPFVVFAGNIVPDKVLTVPILAAFIVTLSHFVILYATKVRVSAASTAGALVAAMSVQWTIARAVGTGLVKSHLPFVVTAKGGVQRLISDFPAFWETVIGSALAGCAVLVHVTNYERVLEIELFAIVMAVQSLPFLSASVIAILERTPINDFAFWRSIQLPALPAAIRGRRKRHLTGASVRAKQADVVLDGGQTARTQNG